MSILKVSHRVVSAAEANKSVFSSPTPVPLQPRSSVQPRPCNCNPPLIDGSRHLRQPSMHPPSTHSPTPDQCIHAQTIPLTPESTTGNVWEFYKEKTNDEQLAGDNENSLYSRKKKPEERDTAMVAISKKSKHLSISVRSEFEFDR
ncbi:hypothetical protein RhiJN_12203 [Ceratobasidium sp. AG-Ba]|nr:hypothetical protein RhiJN_12203 [Ceratobasidium sp. AG-Ba]